MAEKVTTVIAFVMVCVGFLVVLALVVQVVDSMSASASRTLAAERRERWEARAMATRVALGRRMPRRVA
jgi:hypothetical protein